MSIVSDIDQKELDELFKKLAEAIKVVEKKGNAAPYVNWVKEWFEKNSPQYLN